MLLAIVDILKLLLTVATWIIIIQVILSWLLTVAAAGVGLRIALGLWSDYVNKKDCPAPETAPAAVAPPPAPPSPFCQPAKAIPIKLVSVREEAVEINANGNRFDLPGYPPPSTDHEPATLTTAVVSPDGEQVAIAGICHGNPGSGRPTCARTFVRIYQALDGAQRLGGILASVGGRHEACPRHLAQAAGDRPDLQRLAVRGREVLEDRAEMNFRHLQRKGDVFQLLALLPGNPAIGKEHEVRRTDDLLLGLPTHAA